MKLLRKILLSAPFSTLAIFIYKKQGGLNRSIWDGGRFNEKIEESINTFLSDEKKSNKKYLKKLEKDIILCYLKYGATPSEYFQMDYENADSHKRSLLLTNYHKDTVLIKEEGFDNLKILRNKYLFYKKLGEYFYRDVCLVNKAEDFKNFANFFENHKSFIVKNVNGKCAVGTKIVMDSKESAQKVFDSIISELNKNDFNDGYLLEELIVQDSRIAQFNPSSVNTIRLHTFIKDGKFYAPWAIFRTGRKGSFVDNTHAGGVFAKVDTKNGFVCTDAIDEKNNSFKTHPDSHMQYEGFEIPEWNSLLNLAEKCHRKLMEEGKHKYIGWDFALSDKGWVLVEGDWARIGCECIDKLGRRKAFDNYVIGGKK